VQLVEKVKVNNITTRKVIEFEWTDSRLGDPVANHGDFRPLQRPDADGLHHGGYRRRGRGRPDDAARSRQATRSSSCNYSTPREPVADVPPESVPGSQSLEAMEL
jgi:hypothetical protein